MPPSLASTVCSVDPQPRGFGRRLPWAMRDGGSASLLRCRLGGGSRAAGYVGQGVLLDLGRRQNKRILVEDARLRAVIRRGRPPRARRTELARSEDGRPPSLRENSPSEILRGIFVCFIGRIARESEISVGDMPDWSDIFYPRMAKASFHTGCFAHHDVLR